MICYYFDIDNMLHNINNEKAGMIIFDSVKEMERNISWCAKLARDKSVASQYKCSVSL